MAKRYAAMVGKDLRLTSVLAVDKAEAEKKVRRALNRRGRRQLFLRWVREGCKLMEVVQDEQGKTS